MSVTYPGGFRASGISAGLKESGRPDLALLVADGPAVAAGAFTTSVFPAAPVTLTKAHLANGSSRGVVVNSGQANAGTGAEGMADAEETARAAAGGMGCEPGDVLVCSTGVIGPRVPLDRLVAAIPSAVDALDPGGGAAFAEAICTTDTMAKLATADAGELRVGGCAKGAGMIGPRLHGLATLLAFVTTDAPITRPCLEAIVAERVVAVWNSLVVDGCQSTNDTVLVLASGAAGGDPIGGGPGAERLGDAIEAVCQDLARQVAAGAEGASKAIVVHVEGAGDAEIARRVGLAVAGSPLVKTAVFGGDPNPGRILQAIGDTGGGFDPDRVAASLGGIPVLEGGVVLPLAGAKDALEGPEVLIRISLGDGPGQATVFGCDLGYEYVRINAEYST